MMKENKMDKDYLIKRYNWFERIQTYPPEN